MRSYRLDKRLQIARSVGLTIVIIGLLVVLGIAQGADETVLEEIRAESIPAEDTETEYGIPLSLTSLPQFIEWWYTLVPLVEADARYFDGLSVLVAPCCDDNTAFSCCCEGEDGQACNIIRSGKGLAAHLIRDLDYDAGRVTASVLEWFRFARPDYYLASALTDQDIAPELYGLTVEGSCYRGMCNTPISGGGCGGMKELTEPAIETTES